ncbi:zinc finger protein 845-like [Esox lucius]|uniref:zinc finger protein 845-like n=1 Tax=Esox lucius TaxID=8010 RepID=UPI00147749AE|nr:zinc finger protein 845-like [Esox lucius]
MQSRDQCENGTPLLLPSLRLFIPPLRLVSAAMWQVVLQGHVQDYGMLEEFVTTVTEIVPELLSSSQRAQLILGLRARLVLELFRMEQTPDLQNIRQHLDRIRSLTSTDDSESNDAEVELTESNFVQLVESLMKDPSERENFFQDVFPVEFGPQYDTAIQMLMLEFLTRLEKLLPIPDLEQTASLLNAVPSALEQCVQSVPDPRQLRTLLQYHRKLGHVESVGGSPTSFGDSIISSLSLRPYVRVVSAPDVASDTRSEKMHSEGTEAAEMSESQPEGSVGLVAADDVPRCIITEQGFAMDMQSAVVEIDSQAVTSLNSLRISRFQPLKRSKRLQIKKMCSKGRNPSVVRISHKGRKPNKADSCGRPVKQLSPSNVLPTLKKSFKRAQFSKTCEVCGKTFTRVTAMKRHQLTHTGDLKFKCLLCEKQFRDGHNLKRHQRRVCEKDLQLSDGGKDDKEIPQPSTSKSPNTSSVKTSPPGTSTQGPLDTKTCSVCGRFFARTSSLVRHMSSHSKERPFKCVNCDKRFKYSYDLRKHRRGLCKKMTRRDLLQNGDPNVTEPKGGPHLEKGVLSTAENQTQVDCNTCNVCGKILTCTSSLVRHMSSHSKERPFKCANCDKRFKYAYDLKKHQRELCKKMTPGDLSQDGGQNMAEPNGNPQPEVFLGIAENQTQVDSRTCQVCGKILTFASQMERHLKSHSRARPYNCATCERSFKYKDSLKKHQEILGHEGILEDFDQGVEEQQAELNTESYNPLLTKENDTVASTTDGNPGEAPKPHTCTVCGKVLDCAGHLATHMRSHSEERPYQCVHCDHRFKYMQSLNQHQKYTCKANREETSQVTEQQRVEDSCKSSACNINAPESTDELQLVHWCKKCGKSFDDICSWKQHQENVCKEEKGKEVFKCETKKVVFKCDDCGKDFKGSRYLRTHKRIHSPFYCSDCGRVLPNSIAFERHKLVQHKEIQCTMCEKTFTLLGRLRDHYLHQHKFTGPYPCSQCEKTFIELRYLVEHETIHSGEFPYQCSVCQKKFRTAKSLTLHSRKHTGEKPFLCWQCGKSYKDHGNLAAHMGTHSEEKPFSCSQCEMTYRTKIQLNTHIEQVHDGVRYTCSICGKQFLKAVSVKRHELTHTGERPWPCSYCTKTFITANERRLHERYHTGERPYKCQECGKSFVQSCFLKSHQRLHTGERPFACSICDKSFRLNYHKQRHEQTHTGKNKPHVCGECGLAFTQRKRLTEHQRTHSLN